MNSTNRIVAWVVAFMAVVLGIGVYFVVTAPSGDGTAPQSASNELPALPAPQAGPGDAQPQPGAPAATQPQGPLDPSGLPVVSRRMTDPGQEDYLAGRYDRAIAFWTQAAANGDAVAAYHLGVEYMDGKPDVVQRDYAKAMKYHLQAADVGDPRSMFDIGSMYEFGFGVAIDLKQAFVWYKRSADYGLAQGQYNVATMLESGEGGVKDDVEAFKYYQLAADQGFRGVPYDNQRLRIDNEAPDPITLLTKKLSPAQIQDAKARAAAFKALTGPLKTP